MQGYSGIKSGYSRIMAGGFVWKQCGASSRSRISGQLPFFASRSIALFTSRNDSNTIPHFPFPDILPGNNKKGRLQIC